MDDLISRKEALRVVEWSATRETAMKYLKDIPSVQKDICDRKAGEWDMFELITSTWYGKQCYFKQENDVVYSRISYKHMSVDEAINEFLKKVGDIYD